MNNMHNYNNLFTLFIIHFLQDLRRKAARICAAKCTLAARVDACHESVNGQVGKNLREEIEKKLDKLQVRISFALSIHMIIAYTL